MEGIILVNKDKDMTSRDVINNLCLFFGMKKIGHTGTLDPLATGVLVVCFGRYTKLIELASSLQKEYIAEIKIGIKTDTLDITGSIIEEKKCNTNKEEIINVLNSLKGKFTQTIPLYSAKKINGKKLYEYARNGINIKLPKNEVEIFNIELLEFKDDLIKFKVLVSKGTYIRSLIEEICNRLNIIGTMNNLIRTKQGKFDIEDSYTLNDIKNNNYKILKAKDILDINTYNLNEDEYKKVINGSKMKFNIKDNLILLIYNKEEIAIYEKDNDIYRVKVFLKLLNF